MDLQQLLNEHKDEILTAAQAALARARVAGYEKAGEDVTATRLRTLYDITALAVRDRHLGPMIAHAGTIAKERFEAGIDLWEVQTAFNVLEETVWVHVLKHLPAGGQAQALGLISTVLGAGKDALARGYVTLAGKVKAPSLNLQSLFRGVSEP